MTKSLEIQRLCTSSQTICRLQRSNINDDFQWLLARNFKIRQLRKTLCRQVVEYRLLWGTELSCKPPEETNSELEAITYVDFNYFLLCLCLLRHFWTDAERKRLWPCPRV